MVSLPIFFHRLRSTDWFFHLAVFALVLFGLAAIYSVTLSQQGGTFLALKKQFIAAIIGFVLFLIIARSNYRLLRGYAPLLYFIGVISLVAVLLFGQNIRGTTGWFEFGPINFQPVEFMKLALIVALASYFSRRSRKDIGLKELLVSGVITFIPVFLVLMQPDLGSASMLIGIWIVLMFFVGLPKRLAIILGVIAVIISIFSWQFLFLDYQKARISAFIDPSVDPLGQGYNVHQAIIAVGAGGVFGRGLGFGSQSQLKFLPESQTDFIFAVIAEELGFFGVTLVILAFGLLFARIYHHASNTRDDFTSLLILGIVGLILVQFIVNVGMNLGMLPVTGVGLPLVSYGGSSLVFMLLMLGVVESAILRSRRLLSVPERTI